MTSPNQNEDLDAHAEELLVELLDDPDFQSLSAQESKFNIFEALGTRRQELRHSDFLSYILDPNRPHGLGDRFLRDFLLHTSNVGSSTDVFSALSLRLMPLDGVSVKREKHRVDVLIEMAGSWAVVIENKIDAGEHGDQLLRYKEVVAAHLGGVPSLLLYLTPSGELPSDDDWAPISHTAVRNLAEKWSQENSVPLHTRNALSDYKEFLEAYVLEDSKTAEMCREIYKKHREAIDLLIQHIPDIKHTALDAAQQATERLAEKGIIKLDDRYKKVNRFFDATLENLLPEVSSQGSWTKSNKGILFEWEVTSNQVRLDLVVGPIASKEKERILKGLLDRDSHKYRYAKPESKYCHVSRSSMLIDLNDTEIIFEESGFESLVSQLESAVEALVQEHHENLSGLLSQELHF